jgi:lipopolysaccharide export system permease protein
MTLVERYTFRIAASAFVVCLVALTGVIWVTQALRELDLLTSKGQTILMFLTFTSLTLPGLVTVISPVALFIATIHTLSKLNGDSELIVMSASGMRPLQIMRPFAALAGIVSVIVSIMAFYLTPASFQELRELITRINADFVANVIKEGQFTTLESGIVFHVRERTGGALFGILMQDRREKDKVIVYLAERGQTVELNGQSYLVLEQGSVHQQEAKGQDASVTAFERYAVDLSAFMPASGDIVYKPRERSTTQLMFPDPADPVFQRQKGRFRAELHDRFSGWLYPIAMMLIAFAALGDPRTTRQGRGVAVSLAIVGVVLLRILGFAVSTAMVRSPAFVPLAYALPLVGIGLALLVMFKACAVRQFSARTSDWFWQSLSSRRLALRGAQA